MHRGHGVPEPDREVCVVDDRLHQAIVAALDAEHLLATGRSGFARLLDDHQCRQAIGIGEEITAQRRRQRAHVHTRLGTIQDLGERLARNLNSRRRRPIASRRLECGDCGCQVALKLTPDDRLRSHHPHAPAVRQCQTESGPKDPPQRHAQHPRQANERVVIGIDELAAGFRVKGRERAVAKRPDASADAVPSLENRHVGPSPRQFPCGDQSGETGTDDHDAAAAKR